MRVGSRTWTTVGICIILSVMGVGMVLTDAVSSPFAALSGTAYAQTDSSNSEGAKNASPPANEQEQVTGENQQVSDTQKLLDLKQRERELERREAALEKRRLMLETQKGIIDQAIARNEVLVVQLQDYTKKADAKRKKLIAQLVLSMQVTQATNAAEILEGLEVGLAVEILSQMTDKKAGKIIDVVKPEIMIKIIQKMSEVPRPAAVIKK